jgi:SAM-dependent MidA family methyltransferase
MPDPDSSPPQRAAKWRQDYLSAATPATPSLTTLLRDEITEHGPLQFVDFMAVALYQPRLGYYAQGTRQVGRGGDFFTSVSVGPLFGALLARRMLREWRESGQPVRWRIIECGAHDGTLARDVLSTLQQLDPLAFTAVEYVIPEPLPALQVAQRQTLAIFHEKTRFITEASELALDPLPGVAFGNELLDALPFHLVEWKSGRWHECRVAVSPDGAFVWQTDPEITDPLLQAALILLGENFPENYRTEVRTNFPEFLASLTRSLSSGLLIWPDYGFARPEYYLPERTTGTLRTFSKHHAAEDPLTAPGQIDITAHVDFTAVAEAGITLGCQPLMFTNQGTWLTEIAREWLLTLEGNPDPQTLRQFQTLTHPAHLGGSFHVLELAWKRPCQATSPGNLHRLALRACPLPASQ